MAKRHLFLIRNGQYVRDETTGAGPLTPLGREQARLTAQAMRDLSIDALDCSPYQQVLETTDIFSAGLQLDAHQNHLLRQYDSIQDMKQRTLTRAMLFAAHEDQRKQLQAAYEVYFQPPAPDAPADQSQIIVCHANIIRDLICYALGVNPASWAHMVINHCGISVTSIDANGELELVAYNDTNHLPDDFITEA